MLPHGSRRVPGFPPPTRVSSSARMPLRPRPCRCLDRLGGAAPAVTTHILADAKRRLLIIEYYIVCRIVTHDRGACCGVVTNCDHAIHSFTYGLDVCDENDLLEPILQSAQQFHDVEPPGFVERAENLVENKQREALAGSLGNHLRNCQ